MPVEGMTQRDVVVTFNQHFASYAAGESAAFTEDEAQRLAELGVVGDAPPPTSPPVNVDVPYSAQENDLITCTMGNWEGEPTSYAYQWKSDGTDVGDGTVPYTVTAADAGHTFTCVVTATNAAGSTAAPPSNDVLVTEPTTSRRGRTR